jgi:2-keto-3-deoxy-L-fuconate dehydrogenase
LIDFANHLALVTGAASGIGAATARHLGITGARLVLVDRNGEGLDAIAQELGESVASALEGDVADEGFWDRNMAALTGLRLAVVNAGVAGAAPIAELSFAEWRRIVGINLDGAFLTLRAAMRAIEGRGGAIVVTASAAGIRAEPGVAAYGASKAALIHLAKVAAKEGAPRGIRVNAIAPGGVETPVWRNMDFFKKLVDATGSEKAAFAELAKVATPLGRYADAAEIAAQIAFLLSSAAATITGATLTSDGGYTL